MRTWCPWLLLLIALLLRVLSFDAYEHPRGDVLLDVGVTASLAEGEGFRSGFERSVIRLAGADTPLPPQGFADQHPPLWPLLGSALAALGMEPFAALKLLSWIAALGVLMMTLRVADRFLEDRTGADGSLPIWGAALVALSFVMIDGAGNGSLYSLQALLLLVLVDKLGAARPSAIGCGLVLGALALLNHQCLVLLPVPLLVLWLAPPAASRTTALRVGLGALVVALLCQLPWWWRNASVFGDPMHSVNGLYLLYRAGVPTSFGFEDGQPVLRFVGSLGLAQLPSMVVMNLRQNLPWLMGSMLVATGGLAVLGFAALPALLGSALRSKHRRFLAILVVLALQLAVSLLWPAAKLRYLIPLTPLLVLLGLRALTLRFTRGQLRLGALIAIGCALLGVRHMIAGGIQLRGLTWMAAAVFTLGVILARRRSPSTAFPALVTAAGVSLALAVLPWGAKALTPQRNAVPLTSYHSHLAWLDVFGGASELTYHARAASVERIAQLLRERGARHVLGPLELLGHDRFALVEETWGLGDDGEALLEAFLAREPRLDHLVLDAQEPGFQPALRLQKAGRLEFVNVLTPAPGGPSLAVFAVPTP